MKRDHLDSISRTIRQDYERRSLIAQYSSEVRSITQSSSTHKIQNDNDLVHSLGMIACSNLQVKNRFATTRRLKSRITEANPYKLLRPVWQPEVVMAGVILLGVIIPLVRMGANGGNYDLASAHKLLSGTAKELKSKLKFDAKQQAWQFNQQGSSRSPNGAGKSSVSVGNLAYSASLPTNLAQSQGLTLTDTNSKQTISLKPQFALGSGRSEQGHVVYPLNGSQAQLIYTFKQSGVKEDIVLYQAPAGAAEFNYKLQLPTGMEARLRPDGSIGIFGGSPSLFGNISYGSDKDEALVEKAREHSEKIHLYYVIPAPAITGDNTGEAKAKFELKGSQITIKASNLAGAHYPLSLDPSFVMDTTGCGWQTGNTESNVSLGGCKLSRSDLSGGEVSSWTTNTITSPLSDSSVVTAVSNGYLYIAQSTSVYYAAIDPTTGSIGSFTAAPSTAYGIAANLVAYNGYLYTIGGVNGLNGRDTVQMAKINSDGSISSWTTLMNTLTTSRLAAASFAYNGRLYALGGCRSSLVVGCSSITDVVEYATIHGDGTLSSWNTTTALPTPEAPYITEYNGYVYAVSATTGSATYATKTLYAAINSDGTIGSWRDTSTLPNGSWTSGIISNGYMYLVGGFLPSSAGTSSDVYAAKVYADGSLGPYQATTSLSKSLGGNDSFTYNGRVYTLGGCTNLSNSGCGGSSGTVPNADILYSTISTSPGDTSGYTTDTYNPTALNSFATVAYGGYLYIIGGTTSSGGSSGSMLNTVRYAPINRDGSFGTWTTSSTGFNTTMTGTGTFCSTAGNCPGRVNMAAAAYDGYLYIAGGANNGGGPDTMWSDVQSAPLDAATGAPGTWTTVMHDFITNSATVYNPSDGRAQMDMQIYNGKMYLLGGFHNNPSPSGTNYADIYYSTLNADGTVENFTHSSVDLPSTRAGVNSFVHNNRLYIVGGGQGQGWASIGNDNDDVQFIPVNSDGSLDGTTGWKDANAAANGGSGSSFTTAGGLNDYGVSFSNGYLYVAGGWSTTGPANTYGTVYKAYLNDNGGLGNWTTTNSLAQSRYGADSVVVNGYLYAVGGCSSKGGLIGANCVNLASMLNSVEHAQIYNNGGGSDGDWASATTLPEKEGANMAVASGGYLYSMGGCDDFYTVLYPICSGIDNKVYYAKINGDGSLGAWTATSTMVDPVYLGAAVTYGGRIYVAGGCIDKGSSVCGTLSDGVQYATICTGVNLPVASCTGAGAVSPWQYTYNSTTAASYVAGNGFNGGARWYLSAAVSNAGYIYVAGGADTIGNTPLSDASQVQYAKINPDGTVGSWTNTSLYTTPRIIPALAINGDYILMAGGRNSTDAFSDVQSAQLAANGAVGSWSRTTNLAKASIGGGGTVLNGYFYVWSGGSSTTLAADSFSRGTQYAPVLPGGKLGKWTLTPGYANIGGSVGRLSFGSAMAGGYIYTLGGFIYDSSPGDATHLATDNSAYYAPLQSQPQIAHYSKLVTTDQPTLPANFFTDITEESLSSNISIGFTGATTASPTFGLPVYSDNPSDAVKYPLNVGGTQISYYWLPITIDDSQSMAFGETSGSSIDYLQLNYHSNAGMRLRGGKTFNHQQLQSLDAY